MREFLRCFPVVLLGLGGAVFVAGCNEDPVQPELRLLEYVGLGLNGDTTGILYPDWPRVRVTDLAGERVAGAEVTFSVGVGGGWIGWEGSGGNVGMLPSDSTGHAALTWVLGPFPGRQAVEITTPGADPLLIEREAIPGVVYVGIWDPANPDEEERLAGLPDTMRVHATNPLLISAARERLETTTDPLWANFASIRSGAGLDSAFVFDLDPGGVQVSAATGIGVGTCSFPPRNEAELEELENSDRSREICPGLLRVVAIEEVPQCFLDRLQDDRSFALWYARIQ